MGGRLVGGGPVVPGGGWMLGACGNTRRWRQRSREKRWGRRSGGAPRGRTSCHWKRESPTCGEATGGGGKVEEQKPKKRGRDH